MKKDVILLVINEQHSLLQQQEELLSQKFPAAQVNPVNIPAAGLSLEQQRALAEQLFWADGVVVFVSPIPIILSSLSYRAGMSYSESVDGDYKRVFVFARGSRAPAEEINGKKIYTIQSGGWSLQEIV